MSVANVTLPNGHDIVTIKRMNNGNGMHKCMKMVVQQACCPPARIYDHVGQIVHVYPKQPRKKKQVENTEGPSRSEAGNSTPPGEGFPSPRSVFLTAMPRKVQIKNYLVIVALIYLGEVQLDILGRHIAIYLLITTFPQCLVDKYFN